MFLIVKPCTGRPIFLARSSWWAVGGALACVAAAFANDSGWPTHRRASMAFGGAHLGTSATGYPYAAPVPLPGGFVALLALASACTWHTIFVMRWSPLLAASIANWPLSSFVIVEPTVGIAYFLARPTRWAVFGVLALVPLFLVPRGWRQRASLVALSLVMWWLVTRDFPHPDFYFTVIEYTRTSIPLLYLPCTLMVLRGPNEGSSLPTLERWLTEYTSRVRERAARA